MQTFKTVREAAIAALHKTLPLSRESGFEYGGFILSSESGYTYTKAITSRSTSHVILKPSLFHIQTGFTRVSDYHTHPCRTMEGKEQGYFDKFFSMNDVHSSLVYSGFRTAYMAPTCSGAVYEANIDSSRVVWPAGHEEPPAALGDVIGQA